MSDFDMRAKDPKALVAEILAANRRAVTRVHEDLQQGGHLLERHADILPDRAPSPPARDPFDRFLRSGRGF